MRLGRAEKLDLIVSLLSDGKTPAGAHVKGSF